MIVVCNTSPITNLAAIAKLDLLRSIYGEIIIPQAVYDELTGLLYSVPGGAEVQTHDWINVRPVLEQSKVSIFRQDVDFGEAEAIVLALELSADRLLIDDAAGRAIALRECLQITGVLGILLIAKKRGLIDSVRSPLDDLINQAGFWVSDKLYRWVLSQANEL
jgi:uncharacterized protein